MDLMKRPLTQQRDELAVGQRAGPDIRVQVDDTAARRPEPLVVAAELRPELPGEEQGIALGHRGKPAAGGGAGEDGYVEKPVTIVCPIDAVEQAILLLLVVAQEERSWAESPDQDGSPWRRSRAGGGGGVAERAPATRPGEASRASVDHDPAQIALRAALTLG